MSDLRLAEDIKPTESYNERHLTALDSTPSDISDRAPDGPYLGSNFHDNAPFRGKLTLPHEPGELLVIKGRIWGADTREPLAHVKVDIWQANKNGDYDTEGATDQNASSFIRARVYSDQHGYYEFETIHPGAYETQDQDGPFWRAPHIHFRVRCLGYEWLVTELFFSGDPHHDTDRFLVPALVIQLSKKRRNDQDYEEGVFDIVLSPTVVPDGQNERDLIRPISHS